jgi:PAS domain S-box-containing protein
MGKMSSTDHYLKDELYALIKRDPSIFEFFQNGSLDGVWYWDLENPTNEWMNRRFWTTLGYDPEEKKHLALEWQTLIHPDDLAVALENFKKHCSDPSYPYDQVVRYRHKNGSTVWVRCRGIAIRDQSGKPIRMLGAHNEVTQQKRAEEALTRERDRARGYLDTVEAIIIALDKKGRITLINPKGCRLLGYGQDELIGKRWFATCLPQPNGMEEVYPFFLQLVSGELEAVEYFENPVITRNGEIRQIAWHNSLMHDESGQIIGTLSAGEDVTERKRAEAALRESEERYRQHFSQFPVPIFIWKRQDDQFVLAGCNEAAERITDGQVTKLIGITADQLYDDDSAHLYETLATCYREKRTIRKEFEYRLKTTGQKKWINGTWVFIAPDTVMLHTEDITERRQTESALNNEVLRRESETQKLSQILLGYPIPTFVIDADHKITHWNRACELLTKIPAEEMIGTNKHRDAFYEDRRELMADLIVNQAGTHDFMKRYGEKFKGTVKTQHGYEAEDYFPKLGKRGKWLLFAAAPLKDAHGSITGAIEVLQDITERRIAEEELQVSESRYHQLFESANDAIFILKNQLIVDCNRKACDLFGTSRASIVGLSPLDLSPKKQMVGVPSKVEVERRTSLLQQDVPQIFEWQFLRKDGSIFDAEVSLTRLMIADDPHGLAIIRDITERKKMIRKLKERQLALDEKSAYLEKVNQALKASLDHREIEKRSVEENMFIKLKRFVFPYLEELDGCKISADAKAYVNIINTNLNDIVSNYSKTVFAKYMNLTPTEIRIADFIRDGKNSKAIAQMLGLSPNSVQWHRKNIREKLGLTNKKVNLYTYLASLGD